MGDDDDGDPQPVVDVRKELQDGAGGEAIQGGGGLVTEEELGAGGKGPRNGNPLLLPAGKLAGVNLRLFGEAGYLQKLRHPPPGGGLVIPLGEGEGKEDVLGHRLLHQQVIALEDGADGLIIINFRLAGQSGKVLSLHGDGAGGGGIQQADEPQHGGLSSAAHTDDAVDIPVLHRQGHIPKDAQAGFVRIIKFFGEMVYLYHGPHCLSNSIILQ